MGVAADLITARRVRLNLTKRELALKVGVDPALITHFERGIRKVPKNSLVAMARALSITENEIVDAMVQDYHAELNRLVHFQRMAA